MDVKQESLKPSRDDFRAFIAWHREKDICYICEKPVVSGQAHHGATGAHWSCHDAEDKKAEEAFAKVGGLKLSRKPEGAGRIATKAKKMAVEAIESALGAVLFDVSLWNQQGAYRGPRWDLDTWGIYFKFERSGNVLQGSASTLGTMTACVKAGGLKAVETGETSFDFYLELN